MKKDRCCWARLLRILRAENASPQVSGMFYKATVQAVLLYGSETWNLDPFALKCLESFHVRTSQIMMGMTPKHDNNRITWDVPKLEGVLERTELHLIEHYIEVR